jgi:hypothetical protein
MGSLFRVYITILVCTLIWDLYEPNPKYGKALDKIVNSDNTVRF